MVDAGAAGPQQSGELRDRTAASCFQDCQGTPEDANIPGFQKLPFKLAPLRWSEGQVGHGTPRAVEHTATCPHVNFQLVIRLDPTRTPTVRSDVRPAPL